jgi:hypothetical protein
MPMTHYECLGVPSDASSDQIKYRYRLLAKLYHPDLHQDPEIRSYVTTRMQSVNSAYEILGKPQARESYNRTIGATTPEAGPTDKAQMHFEFAKELLDLSQKESANHAIHAMCKHLETCMALTDDANLRLSAQIGMIELMITRSDAFAAPRTALENARKLCTEIWESYPATQYAEVARVYNLQAAIGLGEHAVVKPSLDALVANTSDRKMKAQAFLGVAEFYRFTVKNFNMAIAMYEMVVETSQDRALKAKARFELARCYDSDLRNYAAARIAYRRCMDEYPGTPEANDCGWRIDWIRDK